MDNFQYKLQKQFFDYVSSNNRIEVIKYFREIEYKPWEYLDEEGNTAILKSTFRDFTIMTITMIDEIKLRLGEERNEVLKKWLNQPTKDGYTPIHYACFRGNIELIIKLTENHADYNITNTQGLNCLHIAAQGNKPQSLVYIIEKFNMDLNSKDKVGSTPLHWASYTGSENVLNFILARNTDINVQDKDGFTPLHLAVISERTRIIKKLLQFNAKKDIKSNNNLTPLQLAVDKEKYNIVDLLVDKSCLSKLLLFRAPLMKVQRSNVNIYFFFVLHLIVEFLSFFILLPFFKNDHILIVYSLFFVQLVLSYAYLINSDPGVMNKCDNQCFLKILENKENILNYCPYCKTKKTKHSLHCFICDQCVDGFDHHCFWVNNCIGKNNYIMFITFLFLLVLNLFLNIFIAIHAIVIIEDVKRSKFPPKLPIDLLYRENTKFIISVFIIITCLIFIIPVLILIGFQIKTQLCENDSIIIKNNNIIKRTSSEIKRDEDEEIGLLNN